MITKESWGRTAAGKEVLLYTLTNANGMKVQVTSFGARLVSVWTPDRNGALGNVIVGPDTLADFERRGGYRGATVGRYCNRIGGGSFELDGQTYELTRNEGANTLHGGSGVQNAVWESAEDGEQVVMTHLSPDGTDGFPGNAELEVRYSLAGAGLMIQYTLTTDAPTVANITNHSYFNLNGHASGSVLGHRLSLDAPAYLETDAGSIPTGRKIAVAGTPMDFTEEKTIGRDINADYPALKQCGGYDHCYVIADSGLRHTAWLTGPETGIRMETLTTQPGVQLYTSNFLKSATACKDGASYGQYSAVCLETQDFPDAPNHPDFPDTTVLPDRPYSATTLYRFDLAPL